MPSGRRSTPLAQTFLGSPAAENADLAALEAQLEAFLAAASAPFSTFTLEPADFLSHARRHLKVEQLAALERIAAADLYLACACLRGIPAALTAFEGAYFPEVERARKRTRFAGVPAEELAQVLRELLFVGPAPKLAEFGGRGGLLAWIRVVGTRTLLNLATRGPKETAMEDSALFKLAGDAGPSLPSTRQFHGEDVRAAFAAALRALPVRDRNLLRQRFLDDVSLEALAQLYAVNRATISRWLLQARELALEATRAALAERLPTASFEELDSVLRSMSLELDVSFSGLLVSTATEPNLRES